MHNLSKSLLKFETDTLNKIIVSYTSESGVRELERCINKIVRKVITSHIKSSRKIVGIRIRQTDLPNYLENEIIQNSKYTDIKESGVVKAVASNEYGGLSLNIEVSSFKGTGKYIYTGFLGDIVKESIEVAMSYIKSNYELFSIKEDYFETHDIHIHFTENGISKDGPSAGIAIVTAILSHIKDKPINQNISMTGEITLKGEILGVGSIKEKSIAASKNNIIKLFIPETNKNELNRLDNELKENIKYILVNNYKEIYKTLFE